MKVVLVSPNGIQELSGGGLYLRSIAHALCSAPITELTVLSKDVGPTGAFVPPAHCRTEYLDKGVYRDIVARLRLSPTYLVEHTDTLWSHMRDADVIVFHNLRCAPLLHRIKRRAPNKRYGIISDNVESVLTMQHTGSNLLQSMVYRLEAAIIQRAERLSMAADFITFITEADRTLFESMYGPVRQTAILPISVARPPASPETTKAGNPHGTVRVLFTAHFGFAPNQRALFDFIASARAFRAISRRPVEFVAAGARARVAAGDATDITVVDAPSPSEMSNEFHRASLYLAPVSWGSGMKTKVAEALSYGLPVICMPNAAEGYQEALGNPYFASAIDVVETPEAMAQKLEEALDRNDIEARCQAAKAAFEALYSYESQSDRLKRLLHD